MRKSGSGKGPRSLMDRDIPTWVTLVEGICVGQVGAVSGARPEGHKGPAREA